MRTFIKAIIAAAALHSATAAAITNMEYLHKQGEQDGLHGNIELSLKGKSGNSNRQTHSVAGQLSYRTGVHQWLTSASAEYGESNKVKDTDNKFIHQRYIHHNSNKLAIEGFVQYQEDTFKLLDSRALVGAGARFKISQKDDDYLFNFGVGAYYTEEVYNLPETATDEEREEQYARANSYINYAKQLTQSTSFSNTLYWQPRLGDIADSYAYNNLAFTVKISEKLALKVTLETQYDSKPVGELEHVDHSYFTSLAYSF
ncbi:DUF481 domain-containing protein [Saccharophagus degradans]|uniref:DUF481 domain-containing protein n=1 Tax=Saccharophagus degradans TaxID=86304 RepID=UPI002478143B|nr:DUF481 domain-containing protein [Saccharophagus degradans]WGO97048.1 DUF481 domain-containing protein [Saccharophagus degradans]